MKKTLEVMFDIYDEIIDRYLAPNGVTSFHMGLDEISPMRGIDKNNLNVVKSAICKCDKCKNEKHIDLVIEYASKLAKHLKEKGIKTIYMYNDTFAANNAPHLNENMVELFKKEGIYDNIVIDWWDYRKRNNVGLDINWGTSHNFRRIAKPTTGYSHWSACGDATGNILGTKDIALKYDCEGIVSYSSFDYGFDYTYNLLADCAWNPAGIKEDEIYERYCNMAFKGCKGASYVLRKAYPFWQNGMERADITTGELMYYSYCYHFLNTEYPQDYPAKVFRKIAADEEKYLGYSGECIKVMKEVYEYFGNIHSRQADNLKYKALNFMFHNDYFYTLYTENKKYKEGGDVYSFKNEAKRLLGEADKLIAMAEDVEIKANQYIIIRNISILRQALVDLIFYVEEELKKTHRPEIDVLDFGKYLSSTSKALR